MVNFTKIKEQLAQYDELREKLIKKSRDVLKLSKLIIYAVHREELDKAAELIIKIEKEMAQLEEIAKIRAKLPFEGTYKIAVQEYAEAVLYYHFVKSGELQSLDIAPEHMVLTLADLTGELGRRAVHLAGKGKVEEVVKIRDAVDKIYGELLNFDLRDGESRRKVDAVKYNLRKLEDLILDMKLKGR